MIHDPSAAWDGPFPYEVLAPAGATPDTPHAEMQDLSFELMSRRLMTPRTQRAWHELRTTRRRLLADLLLYDVELARDVGAALDEAEEELATPGVPPEAEEWLRPPWDPADRLADELDGVPLPPPPPLPQDGPLDALVRFDR
ncbi:hypothetical protein [Streptomyces sp. NPDC048172]|uniref:hypothetical protein n=1 Tax=Streptomyces sp. NPDC048172 TaxID=3365505 RepID=UPI003716D9E7